LSSDIELYEAYSQQILAAERMLKIRKARENLIDFAELMLPDPEDPEDSNKSQFQAAGHHREIAKCLEEVSRGETRRLIITMPPRHGKSELCTRLFPAWFTGTHLGAQVIIAGYSETFAQEEFGSEIRNHMIKHEFKQIFPSMMLDPNAKSQSFIKTTARNKITVTGVGGKTTGKGADLMIIDDPLKNAEEADSSSHREKIWDWYTSTIRTRLMPGGRIVIIMTRWHDDDLVGRILDPEGPVRESIKNWKVLHLPAIFDEGSKNERALWPEWYPMSELSAIKADVPPRWWSALYQGNPSPDDGDYFKKKMFSTYRRDELPPLEKLRIYSAMDLAVSKETANDKSCLITVGIDKDGTMWILDVLWERRAADELVEEIVIDLLRNNPMVCWGEKGQIAKSIGPFLRKRMKEKKCWTIIEEEAPTIDKLSRSRSIRGRMNMGMVRFPDYATWWTDAQIEMLKFPNGKHDDFVDALSLIGLGLDLQIPASKGVTKVPEAVIVGTGAWLKQSSERKKKKLKLAKSRKGW